MMSSFCSKTLEDEFTVSISACLVLSVAPARSKVIESSGLDLARYPMEVYLCICLPCASIVATSPEIDVFISGYEI